MAAHHEEDEQIQELKRWWLENRSFVVAGIVLGVAVVGGWRGWEWHQTRQAEQASALHDQVGEAIVANDLTKAELHLVDLMGRYAATPYAANSALLLAKAEVEAGKNADAQQLLEWVAANARDAEIKVLGQTRLARLHVAAGEGDKALAVLAGVEAGAFEALVQDVRGDANLALGKPEDARKNWQAALDASDGNLADRQLIELKLAALGPAQTTVAPAAVAAPATTAAPATGTTP